MRTVQSLCLLLAIGAGMAVSGCATSEGVRAPLQANPFQVARGQEIAEFRCARCHQIGPKGDSPSLMAPPFHSLYISYSRLTFKKAVVSAAGDGSHTMPGYDLSRDQVDDLLAYLESTRDAPAAR